MVNYIKVEFDNSLQHNNNYGGKLENGNYESIVEEFAAERYRKNRLIAMHQSNVSLHGLKLSE